jgi:hypothetical protein
MPTNTYVALDTQTLSSASTSVTFSSIPQGYTDLFIVANTIIASGTGYELSLQFNGDTATNYSNTYLLGTGSSAISGRGSNYAFADCGYLAGNSGNPNTRIIQIQNYSNTTTNKTVISRGSSDNGGQVIAYVNLWRSTAAITSIRFFSSSSLTYAIGSTFSLYGIAAEGMPYATGGYVTSDSQYYYHTFTSTGAFVPNQALTCDVLTVAGGGSGGVGRGGGAGAGGVLYRTSASLTASSYTVTIGGGGAAISSDSAGNTGTDTTVVGTGLSMTAKGGGGGGGWSNNGGIPGKTGGSGGGSRAIDSGTASGGASNQTAGTGETAYGFAGGNSAAATTTVYGASGGGAGAAGTGNNAWNNGGIGTSVFNSWSTATNVGQLVSGTYYIAGGGGGGAQGGTGGSSAGGSGGGGAGSSASTGFTATPALVNTGGGGGGVEGGFGTSGAGGSGVVIVRYLKA